MFLKAFDHLAMLRSGEHLCRLSVVATRLKYSARSSGNWNPECDFNRDNILDAVDLFALGENYGETAP